jgi:hypothetical protein
MSDDEASEPGKPEANMTEPQSSVEYMRIDLYPGVSYGVPLEESTSSLKPSEEPIAPEENVVPSEMQQFSREENISLDDIALGLNESIGLSKEEEDLVSSSLVNTKKYEDSNKGIEARFFDTIEKYGGPQLKLLLEETTTKYEKERKFYFMLRGERQLAKQKILNKCLLLCALKWRQGRGKKKGELHQPQTFTQYMKQLFAVFKKKGINYCHQNDFNGEAEFHAVLVKLWKEGRKKDSSFATGVQTATFDFDADQKICIAYPDTDYDPFSTAEGNKAYEDRLRYLVFVFGCYFMLRGRKEIRFLLWEQVRLCESFDSNKNVEYYVEIDINFDKSNPLKLTSVKYRKQLSPIAPRVYANPDDELCPVKFLKFIRSVCEPDQQRVFCKESSTAQKHEFRVKKLPYLYNKNLPLGENTISTANKKFAQLIGFENWERCTNHGNRALAITTVATNAEKGCEKIMCGTARPSTLQVSLGYQRENPKMRKTYDKALTGKHSNTPPASPAERKVLRIDDDEEDLKPASTKNPTLEQVYVATGKKGDELAIHGTSDMIDNNNYYQLTAAPSYVTPLYPEQKTVVHHNQLQQIQRNIFVHRSKEIPPWSSTTENFYHPNTSSFDNNNPVPINDVLASSKRNEELRKVEAEKMKVEEEKKTVDEENKELVTKVKLLESQLADLKEKYAEVKQDLRDARQAAMVQKQLMDSANAASLDRKLADLQAAAANNQNNCSIM